MKYRMWHGFVAAAGMLAAPAVARADFSVLAFPQFAQDNALNWVFQILATLLLAFSQLLGGMLGLGTTAG
jgi:hypothetical protein